MSIDQRKHSFASQFNLTRKILRLLCSQSKDFYVEDDTCLERILSAFKKICNSRGNGEYCVQQLNSDDSIFDSCVVILSKAAQYHHSVSGFVIKLFSVISVDSIISKLSRHKMDSWKKSLKTVLDVVNDPCNASLQCAWLHSFDHLILNSFALPVVLDKGINISLLFSFTESSSIFVKRNAYLTLGKLIVCTQKQIENLKEETSMHRQLHKVLQAIAEKIRNQSLPAILKVLTSSLQVDDANASNFFREYLHTTELFENQSIGEELINRARVLDRSVVDLVCTFNDRPQWLSSTLLHELALKALLHSPIHVASYTMLSRIAIIQEKGDVYVHLVILPLQVTLGHNDITYSFTELQAWREVLLKTLTSRSKVANILCNCVKAWAELWTATLCNTEAEIAAFKCFYEMLHVIFELEDLPNDAYPELLQNWKIASSILDCIDVCLANQEKCWMCVNDQFAKMLVRIVQHSDADHRIVTKSAAILIAFTNCKNCSRHTFDATSIMSLCGCLVDRLLDRRWQQRDSALEVLVLIIKRMYTEDSSYKEQFEKCLTELKAYEAVRSCIRDNNSYVRSSALLTGQHIVEMTDLCSSHHFLTLLSSSLTVLTRDTEAFARRSAVKLMSSCLLKSENIFHQFLNTFAQANPQLPNYDNIETDDMNKIVDLTVCVFVHNVIADFDWEVKRNGIEFLSTLYDRVNDESLINGFCSHDQIVANIRSLLLLMTHGYDKSVCDSADDLLAIIDGTGDPSHVDRGYQALVDELDSLLEDVEHRLTSNVISITHHSEDSTVKDDVILDCY